MAAPKISGLGYYKGMNVSGLGAYPSSATAGSGLSGAPVHDGTIITDKLKIGSSAPVEIYHGSTYVHTVYSGDTVVWYKPELLVPTDVVLYVPFNDANNTTMANIKAYTSASDSQEATENVDWFTVNGSNHSVKTILGTSPVGHTTAWEKTGNGSYLTVPASWTSNIQNLSTPFSISYWWYSNGTSWQGSWGKYHIIGGSGSSTDGQYVENYSTATTPDPFMLTSWGSGNNRVDAEKSGTLTNNRWNYVYSGVDPSNGRYAMIWINVNGSTINYNINARGTNSNLVNWSPTTNLRISDNQMISAQYSEFIVRVDDPNFYDIWNTGSVTLPTSSLI